MAQTRVLAILGSLRQASYNTALVNTLNVLAPDDVEIVVYQKLVEIPLFNPDLEERLSKAVVDLKSELVKSNGLIIASPEYAHGITGVLKNALDWLVSGEEFVYMPVALFNTSPRATHAQAALREVITTMSGRIIEKASINIPLLGSNLNTDAILHNEDMVSLVKSSLIDFSKAIRTICDDKQAT